jgi:hypothetical protein
MPEFLIERNFGNVTAEEMQTVGSESKRVANAEFPEIVWVRSHVVQTTDGLMTYCIYEAPDVETVQKHAAAAGLPADRITPIVQTVGPGDFA